MDGKLIFESVFKKKNNGMRFGCINVDVDTMASDLDSDLYSIKSLELADISWSFFMPRLLKLFQETNIKATFFVIGKHLELPSCRQHIKEIIESGHEIANHTMNHRKNFSLLSKDEIKKEILDCHERLANITGKEPVGFRAPGYTINTTIIEVLESLGYKYDASLNISKFHNIAKAIYKHFIVKEKEYFVTQNLKNFPKNDRIYWVLSKQLSQREYPLVLFPINIIPFVHYTFISGSLINFGYKMTRLAYELIRNKIEVLNFELHDVEFSHPLDVQQIKIKMPYLSSRYAKIPIEERNKYFIEIFKLFKTDFKINTFSEITEDIYSEYRYCKH